MLDPLRLLLTITILLSGCASIDSRPVEEQFSRQVVFTVANELAADPSLLTSYSHASFTDMEPALVKEKSQSIIDDVLRFHRLKKVSQWSMKSLGLEAVVAEFSVKKTMEEVMADLVADVRVDSVESVKTYQLLTYNDPYFQLQNSVKSDDIENIHRLATGKDVVIGLVDTGIDRTHPELMDRIIYSRNFVAHDQNRFDQDEHGTTVAGVIASAANNKLGIVGVAPDVKLMVFKSCWQDRVTRRAKCDSVSLMKALVDVINQQPDIVNLSLAGPDDLLIRRLLKAASDRGIVLVAAVDPRSNSSFPASMHEVIAVGTPIGMDESADTFGILAPGTDVLTTTPGATYAFRSGSSMATAYISGIAALMKERQPTLSGEQIRVHLRSTSSSIIGAVPVVDMCAAVSKEGESCQSNSIVLVSEGISPL
ncbi:MAG: S8 family serine peptidase [Gammaproteobacteria bacterium]|nr:S8 family serine peptidase [Gammaproteobacteria bacterium]